MSKPKLTQVLGLWEKETKKGDTFYVGTKMTLGEFKNLLRDFVKDNDVEDSDKLDFVMFRCDSKNEKAPAFHLNMKKDDYKKED